ncbi:alanine racemase [Lentibacillus lipolyticus]|nr:alanine racemase [Lentibacillus lipolyticus]
MAQPTELTSHGPTKAEVDLTAFRDNVDVFKTIAENSGSQLMAVVKTNAYGHGVVPIGHAAIEAGADRLGVTTVEEGALLRKHGISVPIHVLSSITPAQVADAVRYDLTLSVSSRALAEAIHAAAVSQAKTAPVHLKLDTGLHRFGIAPEHAREFCRSCYHFTGLYWEGIYTHFSSADEGDWETTEKQFTLFMNIVMELNECGYNFPIRHAGASTIAMEREDMHLDMIRPGIALFGYTPEVRQQDRLPLKPVMTLKSKILHVRTIPPATPVGYGGNYVTSGYEKLAVVPVGHGDGYKRALSNKGEVLVHGKRAAIAGEISLDQMIINVTPIGDVREGDDVILMGSQGGDTITARDIADKVDSIVDEVLASLMERVNRVYK